MPHDGSLNHSHVGDFFQWDCFLDADKDAFLYFECLGSENAFHAGEVPACEELSQRYPKKQEWDADDTDAKCNRTGKQPVGADLGVELRLSNES